MTLDNPLGRLHQLLVDTTTGGESPLLVFWADYFGVPDPDVYGNQVRIFNDVVRLVGECKKIILSFDQLSTPLYMRPLDAVENAIRDCGTKGSCKNLSDSITLTDLTSLEFCEDRIRGTVGEQLDDDEQLKILQADLDLLIEKILTSSIPLDIRTLSIDGLNEIRRAVTLYRLTGLAGVRAAFENNIGTAFRFGEHMRQEPENNDNEEVHRRYFGFLFDLDSFLSRALRYKPLAESFLKMIGAGDGT